MASPGAKFRLALTKECPLQIVGTINAYIAMMAVKTGFEALYLSGAGVANSAYGLPDLGMTTLDNVLEEVRRIVSVIDKPLLVDIDTGWGSKLMIDRTIKAMERAGAAAVHIEDQPFEKRCGHRLGKELISSSTMQGRIKAAVDARNDASFVIMARTDAFAVEGLERTLARANAYIEAGADMIFLEALTDLSQYAECRRCLNVPLLANITEFGHTPIYSIKQLAEVGMDMVLYPLTVNRAMNLAAIKALETIRNEGTQKNILEILQTREELYGFLNYHHFEAKLESTISP